MRAALCLALFVTAATPALAQDRYGPEPSALRTASNTAIPGQRILTWSNKVDPMAAAASAAPPVPVIPGPLPAPYQAPPQRSANAAAAAPASPPVENAPWRRLGVPQAPQAAPQYTPASATQYAPQAAPQYAPAATPRPADAPQPAPQSVATNTPAVRPTTPAGPSRPIAAPAAAAAPARVPLAGAAPTAPAAPSAPAAAATPDYRTDVSARATPAPQGEQARYYSLHRDYGETPDPIAVPSPTQVFLAAVPLSSLDQPDNQDADTGRTAAENKARLTADWGASSDPSVNTSKRVITRP